MGWDNYFYVLPTIAYAKLIKPKLIQRFGPVSRYAMFRQEERMYGITDRKSCLNKGDLTYFLTEERYRKETPYRKFFDSQKYPEYLGSKENDLSSEINSLLREKAIYQYDQRNPFLRTDQFLPYIGLYESFGCSIRVSNMDQVEIFNHFIEISKKAYKEKPFVKEFSSEYDNCNEAGQIIGEVLKQMKDAKEETVLVISSA